MENWRVELIVGSQTLAGRFTIATTIYYKNDVT